MKTFVSWCSCRLISRWLVLRLAHLEFLTSDFSTCVQVPKESCNVVTEGLSLIALRNVGFGERHTNSLANTHVGERRLKLVLGGMYI